MSAAIWLKPGFLEISVGPKTSLDQCFVMHLQVSASARSTMVITRGVDRGSGLHPVNEVFSWGLGSHVPSRVNFSSDRGAASSSSRWQTHDARIDIVDIAAARCHNIALDRIGRVFSWGFGADNLGASSFRKQYNLHKTPEI